MKIVHVNNIDLHGSRFNGHNFQIAVNKRGHSCKQFVMEKLGNDPNTISLMREEEEPYLHEFCKSLESELSLHAMVYPYGWRLLEHPDFKCADIVHCHLLHNFFFSYAMLPDLASAKPTIITIHDPWLFTGHCVHPLDCSRWETEQCASCPHLDRYFPMKKDKASIEWHLKRAALSCIDVDLVVASKWMLNFVQRSPITSHLRTHHIPFGIDTSLYKSRHDKSKIRKQYGITEKQVVLAFRTSPPDWKNLAFIEDMLDRLPKHLPITLLTCGFAQVKQMGFPIIDMSWIESEKQMVEFYSMADIFLMPSTAESFGLMAIEAMATGLPVVTMEGTAVPSVVFAPNCGIAVKANDIEAFVNVVLKLVSNPQERQKRSEVARTLADKYYKVEHHVRRLLELYEEILNRKVPAGMRWG